jgi:hypothetical protein
MVSGAVTSRVTASEPTATHSQAGRTPPKAGRCPGGKLAPCRDYLGDPAHKVRSGPRPFGPSTSMLATQRHNSEPPGAAGLPHGLAEIEPPPTDSDS